MMSVSNSHPPQIHEDPDAIPVFLCRICHPELNHTSDQLRALEERDREQRAKEAAERQRQRDITKCQRAIASATKHGEPDPLTVGGKILASQRKKLVRLEGQEVK